MRTYELHAATFDVANVGAAEIQTGHEATLADRLADAGLTEGQIREIEQIVDDESERRAYHVAAKTLRRVLSLVSSRSTHGAAIAHALGFGCEQSLAELGAQFGHTKQSIGNAVAVLKDALAPVLPNGRWKPPPVPPDNERVWYTQYQVLKFANTTAGVLGTAVKRGAIVAVEHAGRRWFDEESVIAWAATLNLPKATDDIPVA